MRRLTVQNGLFAFAAFFVFFICCQALCFQFDSGTSSRVLEVYLTLGDTAGLADKIQACFAQAVLGSSHGILRTMTHMKAGTASEAPSGGAGGRKGAGGAGGARTRGRSIEANFLESFKNRPYNELCKVLSIDQFRACLLKTFDVLVGTMNAHYQMNQWYAEELRKSQQEASGGDGAGSGDGEGEGEGEGQSEAEVELIGVIHRALSDGRKLLFEQVEGRIASLLSAPSAGEGEHFLQVLEWTHCFISCGESFCESRVTNLRKHISRTCASFFDAYVNLLFLLSLSSTLTFDTFGLRS